MKVTWFGQSALLLENDKIKILIDPISCGECFDGLKSEKCPIDFVLITHSHAHACNEEILKKIFEKSKSLTVLASEAAYYKIEKIEGIEKHNLILTSPHTVWSEKGVTIYSIHAEHSDRSAVGFIIDDGKKTYYISGDTLYNYDVIDDCLDLVPDGVDYAFLPISGRENNMNPSDAADFAYELDAKKAIPLRFDNFGGARAEDFDFDDKLVLTPFEATEL